MTEVGLLFWFIALEKYFIFLLVSLGIWSDQCVDGYNLDLLSKKKIDEGVKFNNTNDPNFEYRAMSEYRHLHPNSVVLSEKKMIFSGEDVVHMGLENDKTAMDVEKSLFHEVHEHIRISILNKQPPIADTQQHRHDTISVNFYKETTWSFLYRRISNWIFFSSVDLPIENFLAVPDEDRDYDNFSLIQSLVGPRTVLILIIPQLAPLSIFAMGIVGCPIFLLTPRVKRLFPPLFITNGISLARVEEMAEANHETTAEERGVAWTLIIRSVILFWKKSRAIQIFDACFRFAVTIGILYGQPYVWLLLSILVLFPLVFFQVLDTYIFIGKKLQICDFDLIYFWSLYDPAYAAHLEQQFLYIPRV